MAAGGRESSAVAPLSRIGLNDHKAGMQGLDKDKINQIILEASRGSRYYENEVRKEESVSKKIDAMLLSLQRLTSAQKISSLQAMDSQADKLEQGRVLNRIVVHVDMDAFYASVEIRDNPTLRDVPMGVGSQSMLSTSNYAARRFGVRAAMPGFIAKKLCPQLVIVSPHYDKYRAVSEEVGSILAQYDPHYCPMGLDEAYLDITDHVTQRYETQQNTSDTEQQNTPDVEELQQDSSPLSPSHWKLAASVVAELRSHIATVTRLTASAGIAPNMMLAKVASDINKPDGQYLVEPCRERILQFVRQLPIRKVSGIGKVTERLLSALGVASCDHLYQQRATLNLLFSSTTSQHFLRIAMGIGDTDVHSHGSSERKSVSTERTFAELNEESELLDKCRELCECLAEDMARQGLTGRTVTLKTKNINFMVHSRAETVSHPVSSSEELYKIASQLVRAEIANAQPPPLRLRLMGVRVSMLQHANTDDTRALKLTHFFQRQPHLATQSYPTTSQSHPTTARSGPTTSQSHLATSEPSEETAPCPVCGHSISCDNTVINKHLDDCLSLTAINESTLRKRPLDYSSTNSPNKKQSIKPLEDFWK